MENTTNSALHCLWLHMGAYNNSIHIRKRNEEFRTGTRNGYSGIQPIQKCKGHTEEDYQEHRQETRNYNPSLWA